MGELVPEILLKTIYCNWCNNKKCGKQGLECTNLYSNCKTALKMKKTYEELTDSEKKHTPWTSQY